MSSTTAGAGGLAILLSKSSSGLGTGTYSIDGIDYILAVTLGNDHCDTCIGSTIATHIALYAPSRRVCASLPFDLANGKVYAVRVVAGIGGVGVKAYITRQAVEDDHSSKEYECVLEDPTVVVDSTLVGKVGFVGTAGEVGRLVSVFDITVARLT